MCEIILNHFIPSIVGNGVDLNKFYARLELLLNTHSENSMQSQGIESDFSDQDLNNSDDLGN